MKLFIKKMEDALDLQIPKYMTEGSVGMDLYANVKESLTIEPGSIQLVKSGIAISIPKGYEAQIRPRSGLALKHGISIVNTPGTIDSDYRGEIGVILINFGKEPFIIKRGDRIAQMVINKVEIPTIIECENLDETDRSSDGFGSTGI